MANTFMKLVGIGTAVATIGTYVFNFSEFSSKDGLIKQGVDRLTATVLGYKEDLATLQSEYNALMNDLNSTEDALEQARIKLQQIYQKITGQEWDEANGDILDYDFESLLKDSDQYDNNVDGDAIGAVLGLPAGCSTEDIINAINDLIATVQSLEARIQVLEGQVADLESEIATYESEQDLLVEEINGLKAKLDSATAEANAIIDGASAEEQAQLDYINDAITNLEEQGVEVPEIEQEVPEEDATEPEQGQGIVLSGDWSNATEQQQTALMNMFNELGIQNAEVTPGTISPTYIEATVPAEAYNVMIANEYYHEATSSLYIDNNGNIVDRAVANPNGSAVVPNGYIRVKLMQQ